jgi:uncharacterized protein YndB with AHSA1/START domain
MGTTKITAEPGLPYIDMTREFDAPRDLVYRAFTDPDLLAQWLGPRRLTMIVDKFDVRDGGAWRYIHRDQDGTEYGFHGVFHGTPTADAMVQTFEFEGAPGHVSLDAVTLEDRDGRTVLRGHSVYQSVDDRNAMVESGMETGINEGFDRLDELLPSLLAAV